MASRLQLSTGNSAAGRARRGSEAGGFDTFGQQDGMAKKILGIKSGLQFTDN